MNRLLKSLILVVMSITPPCWAANAPVAPHNSVNGYGSCNVCHSVQATLGWGTTEALNNICLSCHGPGKISRADGSITPFIAADFANPFNTYTAARPAVKFQTSHKWSGSDNVPRAGALPPVGTFPTEPLNKSGVYNGYPFDLRGSLACARCHDLHNALSNTAINNRQTHLLRANNVDDAMCLNCHRLRNTSNHLTGSHPVNITYAGSTGVNPSPVSSNPANYTASLPLPNGKVLCSTCHQTHFADSNSSTFDNRSSALFGQISTSKGHLLRVGTRGASSASINICTSCHVNKTTHHGASQNVQCNDCHGGHVDTGEGLPNVFLIKRYMNISTAYGAVRNKQIFFRYTGSMRNYVDGAESGICQACHQVPAAGGISPRTGIPYPPEHNSTDPKKCNDCHNHDASVGSFSGGCNTCHGYPPQTNTVGGPAGKAAGYTGDESATKHKKHYDANYGCVECHYSGQSATLHAKGNFQDVFNTPGDIIARRHGATPTYNPGQKTCSGTYCHSNGNPAGGSLVTVLTPAWDGGTVSCSSCHEASPTTNRHQTHIAKGISCENCHNAVVKSATAIFDKTKHANDVKDINFYHSVLPISESTSCANVYCHSNGKGTYATVAAWTSAATGNCGVCHGSTGINTGAHQKHLDAGVLYGPRLNNSAAPTSCNNCHSYPSGHLNGSVQAPTGCATLCHPGDEPVWTSTGRIACTSCHSSNPSYINKYAPYKGYLASSKHSVGGCASCHNAGSAHIGVPGGTSRLLDTSGTNTVCTTCHDGDPAPARFSHVTAKGLPSGNMLCKECHDPHANNNLSMIKSSIAFLSSTSAAIDYTDRDSKWVDTTTNRGLCQVCHTSTTHFRAGVPETKHATTNCYTCHNHNDDTGIAFKPKGDCNSCHGYPPVPRNVEGLIFARMNNWSSAGFESYSGGGGAHTVPGHIPKGAKASEGWANCAVCHNGGVNGNAPKHIMATPVLSHITSVTIDVDPRYRFNDSRFVIYSAGRLAAPPANATGRCFNASCHFQKTPFWSTEK